MLKRTIPKTEVVDYPSFKTAETYPMQTASLNLADVVNQLDESFSQMLLRKIDEKGLTDSQCYKRRMLTASCFLK